MIVLPNRKVGIEVSVTPNNSRKPFMHAAAVPEERHRNEAPSASFLARLQSQKSHTHALGARLSEPPGLTLGLEEAENVILTDCRFPHVSIRSFELGFSVSESLIVPGPLTLRMMERVVSSMNSTRTWVTPPREPENIPLTSFPLVAYPLLLFSVVRPYRCGRERG